MSYSKQDIDFHDDGSSAAWGGGPAFPAINVKHHGSSFYELQEAFPELSQKQVEDLGNRAWEAHRDSFWDISVQEAIDPVWEGNKPVFDEDGRRWYREGAKIEFTAAGRSDGWLVVTSLGGWETVRDHWDALDVARWGRFEALINAEVCYLNRAETLIETARELKETTDDSKNDGV